MLLNYLVQKIKTALFDEGRGSADRELGQGQICFSMTFEIQLLEVFPSSRMFFLLIQGVRQWPRFHLARGCASRSVHGLLAVGQFAVKKMLISVRLS